MWPIFQYSSFEKVPEFTFYITTRTKFAKLVEDNVSVIVAASVKQSKIVIWAELQHEIIIHLLFKPHLFQKRETCPEACLRNVMKVGRMFCFLLFYSFHSWRIFWLPFRPACAPKLNSNIFVRLLRSKLRGENKARSVLF